MIKCATCTAWRADEPDPAQSQKGYCGSSRSENAGARTLAEDSCRDWKLRKASGEDAPPERTPAPLFQPGQIVATPAFLALAAQDGIKPVEYLRRHLLGDWGDIPSTDKDTNDAAIASGQRIVSRYTSPGGKQFMVITEHDRSATTMLLPSDY